MPSSLIDVVDPNRLRGKIVELRVAGNQLHEISLESRFVPIPVGHGPVTLRVWMPILRTGGNNDMENASPKAVHPMLMPAGTMFVFAVRPTHPRPSRATVT